MKNRILKYIHFQSFQPSFISLLINPFYLIRRSLYLNIKDLAPKLEGKLLDFGCGRKPYENLFSVREYIGIDIIVSGHNHGNSKVDVYYDGTTIPFDDHSFDSLFCSEVLEHVFNPDEVLTEISRVLKLQALAIITIPFCWNEHEIPFDYGRYTSYGIKYLLEKHGFQIIELRKSGNFIRVIWQMMNLYIYELFKNLKLPGLMFSLLLIVPLNILSLIIIPLFPKNKTLYYNNIILAKKIR
jgi:SAM-dependent methyltransferase